MAASTSTRRTVTLDMFAQLEARVAKLEADAAAPSTVYQRRRTFAECQTPAERAAYLAQFNRAKRKAKDRAALGAPVPGESPTVRDRIERAAKLLGVPMTSISCRSGKLWHHGEEVTGF